MRSHLVNGSALRRPAPFGECRPNIGPHSLQTSRNERKRGVRSLARLQTSAQTGGLGHVCLLNSIPVTEEDFTIQSDAPGAALT